LAFDNQYNAGGGDNDFEQPQYEPRGTLAEYDLVDDYAQYSRTLLKDCPKYVERHTIKTKSVKDHQSEINFKNVKTTV
jgi:hypothetical protein